jgi:CBS domain-containing protein
MRAAQPPANLNHRHDRAAESVNQRDEPNTTAAATSQHRGSAHEPCAGAGAGAAGGADADMLFPGSTAVSMKIGTVLDRKGRHVWSVPPDASVYDAVHLMAEKRVEALLVIDGAALLGILAERDCLRRVTLRHVDPQGVRVSEIMTSPVITVTPNHTVVECMRIVTERAVPHLPVVEEDKVVGVVSIGDLARAAMGELDRTIRHLEGYITGRYPC